MSGRVGIKVLLISGSVLLLIGLICGYFYWETWNTNPEAEVVGIEISPEKIHIGGTIRVEIQEKMPWYRRPQRKVRLETPDGLQVINDTEQRVTGLTFGQWTWTSVLELQAYDFGPYKDLVVNITLSPDKDSSKEMLEVSIPELVVVPTLDETMTDLSMASELSEDFLRGRRPAALKWIVLATGLVAVTIAFVFWLLRRRPKKAAEAPPKPWAVAELLIFDLKGRLPLDAETVFVELTDIIRRYIESVYKLPATERTTPEFLNEIKRDGLQLSAEQGLLLTDFLTAADMVKFARVDATQGQIEDAIAKATRFIVETSEPIIKRQMAEGQKRNSSATP